MGLAVLIVDDDPDARDMLAAIIRRAGYSVATACDGHEALDVLGTTRPELIVLDVVMPRMDGAQFREEQRHHADWIRIPTVVMTGAAEEPVLDIAIEETLRKPVHPAEVLALVARHCTHA
jgi:CheY-like chemotaxis protein|nr:response regulator [Kofleriaceae bacterium]